MFDHQVKKDDMRAVYLEYAWDMGWCDPCAADPLPNDQLVALGAFWLKQPARPSRRDRLDRRAAIGGTNVFVTRLHVRYDAAPLPRGPGVPGDGRPRQLPGPLRAAPPVHRRRLVRARPTLIAARSAARFEREAATLSQLTGWDIAQIKAEDARQRAAW